jgi:chromosome segregation ATPase
MARQGIKKEQVYTAAAELCEEGIAPTVQAVRERIGSGSFSTINTHLADWKAENAAQGPADIPAMPEKVQEAFTRIWATAARSAQEDVETQREALEAMRREMDKERAAMAEEIERLEKALEETAARAAQFEADLTQEREAGEEKAGRVTALTIEKTRLEEQVKAAQAGAHAMKNALDTAVNERERDHATHERDRGRWEKEIEQERLQQKRLQTQLEAERSARGEADRQASELKTESARLDERAGAAEARGTELKDQLEALQAKFADLAKAQKALATTKKKVAPAQGKKSQKNLNGGQ